jgi:23S rRNA (cytidine1920-2'-O)/16S rRNA (cytidine1409-2'-O)-methyltransferase
MTLRLDEALVERGLAQSRSRARDLINRGGAMVNGVPARKPAQTVTDTDVLDVDDEASRYVSRAALKLMSALDHFQFSARGQRCLDVGASTGGFTQVLLERGAAHVTAIDVGHGQMHKTLAEDARVALIEGVNARSYSGSAAFIVCDVSFISLKVALEGILRNALAEAVLVALIKPQFEVGRALVPQDGVVKDPDLHQRICEDISRFLDSLNWTVRGIVPSPVKGGDGNIEFLIGAIKA